jgi:predicted anti-sigma-YlaC factor YlaD
MIQHPEADPQAARLHQALAGRSEHDCATAQRQIAVLLDAERAGQDVDAMPAFAALLRHLDRCAACLALYAALAEDLDALLDLAGLPPLPPSPPAFFTPVWRRQSPDSPPTSRT